MESPHWIWDRDSQQGRVIHSIAKKSKNMPMTPEKLNLLTLVELVGCSKMPALVLWGWDVSTGKDWRFGQCGPLHGCTKFVPLAQHRVLSLLSSRIASTLCPGLLEPLYLVSTLGIHGSLDHMCKNKHPNVIFIPEACEVLQTALGRTSTASMRHLANVTHWLARCLPSTWWTVRAWGDVGVKARLRSLLLCRKQRKNM